MAIPLLLSAQYVGTSLYVFFDRAIMATPASELAGFTFQINAITVFPIFSSITQNALIVVLGGIPAPSDIVTVAYDGLGTIVEAAAPNDPAAAFSAFTAFEIPEIGIAYEATVTSASNEIEIRFNEPLASLDGDLVTGWVTTLNAVPISMVGVTGSLSNDQRTLTLTYPSNFEYTASVVVDYAPGTLYTWPTGLVAAFSLEAANLSTDGLPSSQYPLSYVTKYEIQFASGIATPKLGVSLNPVDVNLVAEYGPAQVWTGGIFGITLTNPMGIAVPGKFVNIIDGLLISEKFSMPGASTADILTAAEEWQTTVITRISQALGKVRADDQSLVVNDTVVVQV